MSRQRIYRVWEIIPGLISWLSLILLVVFSFVNPTLISVLILFYVIYWLIRVLMMAYFLISGYRRYQREVRLDWLNKVEQDFPNRYQDIYHLAIIPSYKEPIEILRRTLNAIKNSSYAAKKMLVVIAFEERDQELAPLYQPILEREYQKTFAHFMVTVHPKGIEGEIKGKGPNITWAARQVKKVIEAKKIPFPNIITTTLDADNRVDRNYFANLTWAYLNDPDPYHKSFQPLPMFFNNIWKVPLAVKITALGSSFWQLIQGMRPHYARNFAAHAQSFAALVETDFWSVKTIVEDGHQYWRSYFKFNGNHHVVPIFVPVYMDAVQDANMYETFVAQYLQRRRWFWGVSDIPYVFTHSLGNKQIPFFYKWLQLIRLMESHFSLATQSFILMIGWLPLALHPDFRSTVFGYNFPIIYKSFLIATSLGLIITMAITILIVPPDPDRNRYRHYSIILKELILAPFLLPLTAIFFSALPALDSQTRQLINKPFTSFNVTRKSA